MRAIWPAREMRSPTCATKGEDASGKAFRGERRIGRIHDNRLAIRSDVGWSPVAQTLDVKRLPVLILADERDGLESESFAKRERCRNAGSCRR